MNCKFLTYFGPKKYICKPKLVFSHSYLAKSTFLCGPYCARNLFRPVQRYPKLERSFLQNTIISFEYVEFWPKILTFEILERKQKCTSDWALFEVLLQSPI